jgi:multisubunit Na+/H+ antiporter MnhF subunit
VIESDFVRTFLDIALVIMVLLLAACTWRVIVGPSPADRLQAIDTVIAVLVGIIVLLALVQGNAMIIDVGIALAAFGFVASIAIARYLAEGRMF